MLISKPLEYIKVRKISLYTGKALDKWIPFKNKEEAIKYIENNQSITGSFYYISKTATL